MTEKFNKKQISEMLGVSTKSLTRWSDEKITDELAKNCYKVIDIKKEGRSIYFYVEYEEYSINNDEYLREEFNVKDINNFKTYSKNKFDTIEKETLEPRKVIAKKSNTNIETARNYDRKLKEKGVIETDGYIYICTNKKTGERVLVDEKAYKNYWFKNKETEKELINLKLRFIKNELTMSQYSHLRESLLFASNTDSVYYKVEKSIIKYDNVLYKMLIESN
ncbi:MULTISPECIES: hypothetical protein [Clostridium]|uniref:hypothetical protein n=1 Tax=Clostridium TaxID=1485 RepID=UPI000509C135|nr:hypothetical protein [Clostridium saudiense]